MTQGLSHKASSDDDMHSESADGKVGLGVFACLNVFAKLEEGISQNVPHRDSCGYDEGETQCVAAECGKNNHWTPVQQAAQAQESLHLQMYTLACWKT